MIRLERGFTGAVCTKMYHIGVGFAQPVALERCHTGMLKHPCDNTMSDIRWNTLDFISVVLSKTQLSDGGFVLFY